MVFHCNFYKILHWPPSGAPEVILWELTLIFVYRIVFFILYMVSSFHFIAVFINWCWFYLYNVIFWFHCGFYSWRFCALCYCFRKIECSITTERIITWWFTYRNNSIVLHLLLIIFINICMLKKWICVLGCTRVV